MTTFNLKAPNGAGQVIEVSSGTVYTANLHGIITGVPAGNDLKDLLTDGCIVVNTSGLPMVHGRFYGLPAGGTQAAVLTVASTLYAYPVFIPNTVVLDSISISVTSGQTGGAARAALFYDNGAGYPGDIVTGSGTGALDGTGTAVVGSSAVGLTLSPGWYWVGSIYKATSTMPSVIGATAIYPDVQNAILGSDTAAHALATSGEVSTGISVTATYPVTDMATSFPTFPAGAALVINATSPIVAIGV